MSRKFLEIKNISKRFSGTQALDDVSFSLEKGEVHALLGENGAGKSTLIKIISGVVMCDAGEVLFEGEVLRVRSPQEARQKGINVVYQELSLVPNLTVAENICASNDRMNSFKTMDITMLSDEVIDILDSFKVDSTMYVGNLGIGAQQMVEIAGAVSRKCELLILDEPTASLTEEEASELFRIIADLKEKGVTIIYISHKISELYEIADRVTVLKDGKYVGTLPVADSQEDDLIAMMIGRRLEDMYPPKSECVGDTILRVDDLSGEGFDNISFKLHEGEILGFAGLAGAGRTELCTSIFGAMPIHSGQIYLEGKPLKPKHPTDAISSGIGYLPEDRKQMGIFAQRSVMENTIAATIDKLAKKGMVSRKHQIDSTVEIISQMNTKIGSLDDRILSLSGGNQQKIILSRWLLAGPKVLIADEPTRGIDVGAKMEIYQILRSLANAGMGIIIISSELPEVFGLSDRVIAMYHGGIIAQTEDTDEVSREVIGHAIVGSVYKNVETTGGGQYE